MRRYYKQQITQEERELVEELFDVYSLKNISIFRFVFVYLFSWIFIISTYFIHLDPCIHFSSIFHHIFMPFTNLLFKKSKAKKADIKVSFFAL